MRNIALWATLAILPVLQACSDGGSITDSSQLSGQALTSGIAQGFWPPQPLNITEVEPLASSALNGARALVLDAARRSVLANPSVVAQLGSDYQAFDGSLSDQKSDTVATFLFYDYATDETITIQMLPDNSLISNRVAAAVYQPQEHPDEAATAIAMAADTLQQAGFSTAQLQGTALLAYPAADAIDNPEQQFHSQRLLYVTFGPGNGALPVYSAMVNLSSSTVTDAGLVK